MPPGQQRAATTDRGRDLSGLANAALSFHTGNDLGTQTMISPISVSHRQWTNLGTTEPNHSSISFWIGLGRPQREAPAHQNGWMGGIHRPRCLCRAIGSAALRRLDRFRGTRPRVCPDKPDHTRNCRSSLSGSQNGFVEMGICCRRVGSTSHPQRQREKRIAPPLDEQNRVQIPVELGLQGGALIVVPLNPFGNRPPATGWRSPTNDSLGRHDSGPA